MAKKIDINGLDHFKEKENAMIASEYSSSKTYAVGDYVYHNGTLYKCTTAITTAEAWTSGHWTAAKLADDCSGLMTAITQIENKVGEVSVNASIVNGIAEFNTDENNTISYVKFNAEKIWAGEGTPSTTNIRRITGWISANLYDSSIPSVDNENSISIPFGSTVYHGIFEYDYDNSVCNYTIDEVGFVIDGTNHYFSNSNNFWRILPVDYPHPSCYDGTTSIKYIISEFAQSTYFGYNASGYLYSRASSWTGTFSSVDEINAYCATNQIKIVYRIETPITGTIPITTALKTIGGMNYLWTDVGTIEKATYMPSVQSFVEKQAIEADFTTNYKKYEETAVTWNLTVGLPILYLYGDTTGISKENAVNLEYRYKSLTGSCTLKWQGSSSLSYSKKNYTIKFSENVDFGKEWGSQKKYCLKANYVDFSSSRNVVSAKLWGEIVKSRTVQPTNLYNLPNGGAVDGFPVIVALNDEFHGLFTLNIPKDKWMFGFTGAVATEGFVGADQHSDATNFKATITKEELLAETNFAFEYAPDEDNIDWMVTSLNTAITSVMNANSAADLTTIGQYIDIPSAIDYYIFTCLVGGIDMTDKNYILTTFDGTKWYFSAYDMDSTFGNHWTGGYYISASANPTFQSYYDVHKLMNVLYSYARADIKSRYQYLRSTVMSANNVIQTFYNFAAIIPQAIKAIDERKWTLLPATNTNDISQVATWYELRCSELDTTVNSWT